ncbi:MAG: di- and tricarboxylate transporter [Planctomycetota bacterium]|nr:MAG: di- and tricarboxylate transporter [Planctomycetota bacterium]
MFRLGQAGTLILSAALFGAAVAAPWHPDPAIRRATGIVLAALVLWIGEAAPLGVVALGIPVAATLSGVLTWTEALSAWGDPIVFLFLGTFLLARGLDKHGVFDRLISLRHDRDGVDAGRLCLLVLAFSGAISSVQNNTAVTAMLLPVVVTLARKTSAPAVLLLALSYGATFGGMAAPVGTAPNFIGFAQIKQIAPQFSFLTWLTVGVPVWMGTTLIGWAVLRVARRWAPAGAAEGVDEGGKATSFESREEDQAPTGAGLEGRVPRAEHAAAARRWAIGVFLAAAAAWLISGAIVSFTSPEDAAQKWVRRYLPESLIPLAGALILFAARSGSDRRSVLERGDLRSLDWDTLFLIAGGLCLGKVLDASGAADALAGFVVGLRMPPLSLMFALAGVTVLLSELTSNTATASLLVPIAAALAEKSGIPPVQMILLVALSASLGFALPISTPPNAIVYGTRLIPLRLMAGAGLVVDVLALVWVVFCVRVFG